MVKTGKVAEEAKARKRLTDYVAAGTGPQLEGERVDVETILGDDIELLDFVFLKGDEKYGGNDFAVIQFNSNKGVLCTTSTGAKVIVEALKEMPKQYLPVDVKIIRISSKGGRKYLTIE